MMTAHPDLLQAVVLAAIVQHAGSLQTPARLESAGAT